MHIDAFFDYMLDNHHPYWTELPSEADPAIGESRDGVAAEDDMALRALLPHIRPRRGRKRPDDEDSSVSPSQRPRMERGGSDFSPGRREDPRGSSQLLDLWPTHSAVESVLFPSNDQYARMDMSMNNLETSWAAEDFAPTPLTAHPYSGITPSAGQALWPEETEESKSAITPPKPKTNRRHGAKVVSSAWRSGAPGGSGKTRGRPPLNRQFSNPSNDPSSPYSSFHARSPVFRQHSPRTISNMPNAIMTVNQSAPAPTVPQANMSRPQQQQTPLGTSQPSQAQGQNFRLTPSRLSLHVPDRTGGEVRLATPPGPQQAPPFIMINGSTMGDNKSASSHVAPQGSNDSIVSDFGALNSPYAPFQQQHQFQATVPPVRAQYGSSFMGAQQPQQDPSHEQKPLPWGDPFTDQDDRTNIDELESLLAYDMVGADWSDSVGSPIPPCSAEEAVDISQQIIKDAMNTSATEETFLLHVAALAGSSLLRSGRSVQVQKMISGDGFSVYDCHWELRLGNIKGTHSIRVTLTHNNWNKRGTKSKGKTEQAEREGDADGEEDVDSSHDQGNVGEAELWQRRYRDLLAVVQQRNSELSDFRTGIIRLCQQPRPGTYRG